MLITDSGVLVRTRVGEIRELGRATQGVTLIALDDGAKLIGLQRIVENDAAEESPGDAGSAADAARRFRRRPNDDGDSSHLARARAFAALACWRRGASPEAQVSMTKHELAQKAIQLQQAEIESVARRRRRAARRADGAGSGGWRSSVRCRWTSARRSSKSIDVGGEEISGGVVSAGA